MKPGSVTLPAGKLYEIARSLPDSDVQFKLLERHIVSISCERTRYKIAGQPRDEFPKFPDLDVTQGIELPAGSLERHDRAGGFRDHHGGPPLFAPRSAAADPGRDHDAWSRPTATGCRTRPARSRSPRRPRTSASSFRARRWERSGSWRPRSTAGGLGHVRPQRESRLLHRGGPHAHDDRSGRDLSRSTTRSCPGAARPRSPSTRMS